VVVLYSYLQQLSKLKVLKVFNFFEPMAL